MTPQRSAAASTIGRKLLIALTGLALVIFIVAHLLENIPLYFGNGAALNLWARFLEDRGWLLTAVEILLLLAFLVHIVLTIAVTTKNKLARGPRGYVKYASKGELTSNISSRNMIVTGLVLLVFLVIHVWRFRFGPGIDQGYSVTIGGREIHDLYRVVVEDFSKPGWVVFYSGVMLFLGFHLRHGFWSAFQSLGTMSPRWKRPVYAFALALGVIVGLGFFFMPIIVYFFHSGAAQ